MFRLLVPLVVLASLLGLPVPAEQPATETGTAVQWEGWSFSWRVLPRQGVVLSNVRFQNRSVLKYAGVAEVFVPYHSGSPRPQDQRDHPFGENLISLEPGSDCLPGGSCRAFSADGKPAERNAAVMLHEETPSLVYMNRENRAKAKMLVLWSAYALGDYTYIVQWRFREDGCFMPQVGMTGKLSHFGGDRTNSVDVGANERALAHVHNFFFCLDVDVAGTKNTVEEFNYEQIDARGGRSTGAWTPIGREGGRELMPNAFRSWRVVNNLSRNSLGNPRSYELVPGGTGIYRGSRDEKFAHADLWITKHKPDEVPGTKLLADGLTTCVNNEIILGEDVVLWYMLSVHHQPKAEDWPAMPVEWHGFKLVPRDFLDGSAVRIK